MWYGIISRKQTEYFMGSVSLAGGFIAVGLPLDEGGYLAAIPWDDKYKFQMTKEEFRAKLVRENSCRYIGRGEPNTTPRGFASDERIANLLAIVDAN